MAVTVVGMFVGTVVASGISLLSFGPGIGDFLTRQLNSTFQQRLATAVDLINAFRRGDLGETKFRQYMNENGFNKEQIEILLSSTKTPLNPAEILTLWFRYKDSPGNNFQVNDQWLRKRFESIGVTKERQKEFIEANRPVPSLDDIIRFAVRDVFEPEAVRLGQLDDELPPLFLEEAAKRGFKREDAVNVWRAHWLFPSINQMFEMFHRLFDHPNPAVRFTRRDMNTAFNVADIAPGMRARLQAIAYQPIGRVDIRRFDRMGVYGKGEERRRNLKRAYQELGYSPDDAELQTEFTIRLVNHQKAIFTEAQILKNFSDGIPKENTEQFAREQLAQLGLEDNEIDLLIKLEKEKHINVETQIKIDTIREDFIEGRIANENQLRDKLSTLGLTQGQVRKEFDAITREAERSLQRPSISKADELLQSGIINETEWRKIYSFHGYRKSDQQTLLKLVKREQSNVQRLPSKDDLMEFLANGIIDQDEWRGLMTQIGYSSQIQDYYLQNAGFAL